MTGLHGFPPPLDSLVCLHALLDALQATPAVCQGSSWRNDIRNDAKVVSLQPGSTKEGTMFHTIVLGTDGSAASERACDFAASLACRYTAKVFVLHALNPPSDRYGEPNYSQLLDARLAAARTLVENVACRLRELGVTEVETDVIEGSAVEVVLNVLATRTPDLLVIGARGMSPWKGLLLGSVSLALTQRAACPVLVVK
jgi:nucleotide-binding universal stress UspA family protein